MNAVIVFLGEFMDTCWYLCLISSRKRVRRRRLDIGVKTRKKRDHEIFNENSTRWTRSFFFFLKKIFFEEKEKKHCIYYIKLIWGKKSMSCLYYIYTTLYVLGRWNGECRGRLHGRPTSREKREADPLLLFSSGFFRLLWILRCCCACRRKLHFLLYTILKMYAEIPKVP